MSSADKSGFALLPGHLGSEGKFTKHTEQLSSYWDMQESGQCLPLIPCNPFLWAEHALESGRLGITFWLYSLAMRS